MIIISIDDSTWDEGGAENSSSQRYIRPKEAYFLCVLLMCYPTNHTFGTVLGIDNSARDEASPSPRAPRCRVEHDALAWPSLYICMHTPYKLFIVDLYITLSPYAYTLSLILISRSRYHLHLYLDCQPSLLLLIAITTNNYYY